MKGYSEGCGVMSDWDFDDLTSGALDNYSQEDLEIYRELAHEHDGNDRGNEARGDGVRSVHQPFSAEVWSWLFTSAVGFESRHASRCLSSTIFTCPPTKLTSHSTHDPLLPAAPPQALTRRGFEQPIFGYDAAAPLFDTHGQTPTSVDFSDNQGFVTIEDSETDSSMPATTRRRASAARRTSIVDLTDAASHADASSSRPLWPRKRSADTSNAGEGPATKRKRSVRESEPVEELDLTNGAPMAEDQLLQAQQQEVIKAQQAAQESTGPQRIGKRQCIICMENYTNCTATSCGHFYCHECLVRALMAGARSNERGTGTCPVCRKPLSHTGRKKTDVIPMSFMKKSEYDRQKRMKGS